MKFASLLLIILFLTACGGSSTDSTLDLPPAEPPRAIEDYNPDNDKRALDDLIVVDNLPADSRVNSPFTVTGKARGSWFFEGSFPVKLRHEAGMQLAKTFATAEGEWMTSEFVPFSFPLSYKAPKGTRAFLELMLDNPGSPDEGFDRSLIIPVVLE